tara:strand:+ start:835 stop:969 length:135 start_codon:yes stop_codon:yes gene_type:complete
MKSSLKQKPTLNELRMGKNCYEKEKLSLNKIVIFKYIKIILKFS